jgi:hypothetical protein
VVGPCGHGAVEGVAPEREHVPRDRLDYLKQSTPCSTLQYPIPRSTLQYPAVPCSSLSRTTEPRALTHNTGT